MSRVTRVTRVTRQQQVACGRVAALAHRLVRDLEELLGDGESPVANSLGTTIRRIDYALGVGLGTDLGADPELAYRRGHARNVALMLRRTVDESLGAGVGANRRADLLSRAMQFAVELTETVTWIRQRAAELEAPAPVEPWTSGWAGRLLALTAWLLPPERRREFVEDQCGNLAAVESRREWLGYLLGLLTRMPRIAAAAAPGRSRR